MPVNLVALKTALESDPRYDSAVRSGKNRELLALLSAPEPGATVFQAVPKDDVLEAIGDGVRPLTPSQLETLRLYTSGDQVDFRRLGIRTEIQEIFRGNQPVLDRLTAVSERTRSYGEAFGDDVTLRDLWAVLKQIPKSYMAQYLARG